MSNYIVGLDFGTHQTKVCIEDTSNRWQPTYEFFEFPGAPQSQASVLFPSIVQINSDGTVSYGFVNPSKAMVVAKEGSNPPVKATVPTPDYKPIETEPTYESLPPKPEPKHKGYLAVLAKLLPESEEIKKWKQNCASIERANENRRMAWMNRVRDINKKNEELKENYLQEVEEADKNFDAAMEAWREDLNKSTQMRFRYFKQATFFYRDIWTNDFISPEEASIWYLAYIRFLLNQKLGDDYIVRMGVPCSYEDLKSFEQRAYNLWRSAGKLVYHYKELDSFLRANYQDLRQVGQYEKFPLVSSQPFVVRTEAQASLFAVISNQRIDSRINLLFDIGGGTTDIAVFHITPDGQLKILELISVPLGLNYVFEAYQKEHPNLSLEQIQTYFAKHIKDQNSGGEYENEIIQYRSEIGAAADQLAGAIMKALLTDPAMKRSAIIETLKKYPCVFSGGGAIYESMRNVIVQVRGLSNTVGDVVSVFTDRKVVNRDLLGIQSVKNKSIAPDLYQILAPSYGLALSDNWSEVPSENISETFKASKEAKPIQKTMIYDRNDEAIK